MAVRKGAGKKFPIKAAAVGRKRKTSGKTGKFRSWPVLFWLAFIIFIFGFFLFNWETISRSFRTVISERASRSAAGGAAVPPSTVSTPAVPPASRTPPQADSSPRQGSASGTAPVSPPPASSAARSTPAPAASSLAPQSAPQARQGQAEPQERGLYFIQVDRDGTILRIRANRRFPSSDTPMTDVIRALIAGPNTEEKQKGLISLVPPETKILSATVTGNTAHINFSEDFLYNTYGADGYAGQVRQIVFTATEFSNVRDVQITIEGRRVDYLGGGIWIGGPLRRDMF